MYLICALAQVLLFGVSYWFSSVIIQATSAMRFSSGDHRHFTTTLTLFAMGTAFQWLVTRILKGEFSKGVAALHLVLLTLIIFHRARPYHSLLLVTFSLLSVIVILVLYRRLQQTEPHKLQKESDVLDDSW